MSSSSLTFASQAGQEGADSSSNSKRSSIETAGGIEHRDLPLLGTLLDKESMTRTFRDAPEVGAALRGTRVKGARQISHRAGKRALIAYLLMTPGGKGPVRVFGKHFSEPIRAERLHSIKQTLWAHAKSQNCRFATAQPLGWVPPLGLVLFAPVEGVPLDRVLTRHPPGQSLRRSAECVAALHRLELSLDRHLDIVDEWANLEVWAATVEAAHPEHASTAREIARRLIRCAPDPPARQAPIHKDLHYHHLILGSKPALIDLDEMRVGDPGLDVAHFSVHLDLLGLRLSMAPSRVETLKRSFLDYYSELTGWVKEESFAYFSAYSCLKIARQLCTRSGVRPRPRGAEQSRQLQEIVVRGVSLARALA